MKIFIFMRNISNFLEAMNKYVVITRIHENKHPNWTHANLFLLEKSDKFLERFAGCGKNNPLK